MREEKRGEEGKERRREGGRGGRRRKRKWKNNYTCCDREHNAVPCNDTIQRTWAAEYACAGSSSGGRIHVKG